MLIFVGQREVMKRCILNKDVPWALKYAYPVNGHVSIAICMNKLNLYYWPSMIEDIKIIFKLYQM